VLSWAAQSSARGRLDATSDLTGAPDADLGSLILDRPVRQAGWTAGLHLVAAAPVGDDQEVLVNPGDLRARQASQ
jgi:hypothetical protein